MQVEDERRHADQYKEQVGGSQVDGGHHPGNASANKSELRKCFQKLLSMVSELPCDVPCSPQLQ